MAEKGAFAAMAVVAWLGSGFVFCTLFSLFKEKQDRDDDDE